MPSREEPAPETWAIEGESPLVDGGSGWVRALMMVEARVNGKPMPIPHEMLREKASGSKDVTATDRYAGLSFVGAAASLTGAACLKAMAGWFDDSFEWFWIEITDVLSIELRADSRFRGGALCVWVVSPIAEYALMSAWPKYCDDWEGTLRYLGSPTCDRWRKAGTRPTWWPEERASDWPYEQTIEEKYKDISANDPLSLLASKLTLETQLQGMSWTESGPHDVPEAAGEPLAYVRHDEPWVIACDSGIRVTKGHGEGWGEQRKDGDDSEGLGSNELVLHETALISM
ncbi:hypothetical protein RhiJN_06031 [Ceratobasidium sp. AG-Ba]|nr:hypothetical protein RhiJN_06031 [Ceratobasidium sp. AG-Ba]